jgi:hypothetical protein
MQTQDQRQNEKVKVLFIMGWGRSGSTILDNVLNQLDGFVSVGELHYLWERAIAKGHRCGCRNQVGDCELWSRVLEHEHDGTPLGEISPQQVAAWQQDAVRMKHFRDLLGRDGIPSGKASLDAYARLMGTLYTSLAQEAGASVVVDSSKRPSDGALLRLIDGVEPYYVQLVRDPRAVAYSWSRKKKGYDRNMRQLGRFYSAVRWMNRNWAAERLRRKVGPEHSMLVRYEDFTADPRGTIQAIAGLVGAGSVSLPFADSHTAQLGPSHTVSGNQGRFQNGDVRIRIDDEWVRKQPVKHRLVTNAICMPLLHRYGYALRPKQIAQVSSQQVDDAKVPAESAGRA